MPDAIHDSTTNIWMSDDQNAVRTGAVSDWLVSQCWPGLEQSARARMLVTKNIPAASLVSERVSAEPATSTNYFSMLASTAMVRLAQGDQLVGRQRKQWFKSVETLVDSVAIMDKVGVLKYIQESKVCSQTELGMLAAAAARSILLNKRAALADGNVLVEHSCIKATIDLANFVIELSPAARKQYFIHMTLPEANTAAGT